MLHLTVCSCNVTYAFQSESTLCSWLIVKELFAWSRHKIWRLSDCNWTRTQNHLVCKQILNHLAKLAKWLSCVLSTYLYGAFDCMFLSSLWLFLWVKVWLRILESPLKLSKILATKRHYKKTSVMKQFLIKVLCLYFDFLWNKF